MTKAIDRTLQMIDTLQMDMEDIFKKKTETADTLIGSQSFVTVKWYSLHPRHNGWSPQPINQT